MNGYDGATSAIGGWSTYSPSMGGTDPWVIAATTAVPEPSSLALAGLAVTCAVVLGGESESNQVLSQTRRRGSGRLASRVATSFRLPGRQ